MKGYTIDNLESNFGDAWLYIPEFRLGERVLQHVSVNVDKRGNVGFGDLVGVEGVLGTDLAKLVKQGDPRRHIREVQIPQEISDYIARYLKLCAESQAFSHRVEGLFNPTDRI